MSYLSLCGKQVSSENDSKFRHAFAIILNYFIEKINSVIGGY